MRRWFGNGDSFPTWPFVVSMLDFLGVIYLEFVGTES